jgi:peptide/nickel transport system substrate-binding protein
LPKAFPNFDSTKVNGYVYDAPKAQELLKEAGFPNGENLPILTLNTYQSDREVAEYLQKDWEQIGVKVQIDLNHPASHSEKVEQGKLQMFRFSWIADYPDAENFLGMFYSPNFTPVGSNKTHFKNEIFDKLFQETSLMPLGKNRNPNYQKLNQIIMENSPVAVLYYDEVLHLRQNRVLDLEADALNNLLLETARVK